MASAAAMGSRSADRANQPVMLGEAVVRAVRAGREAPQPAPGDRAPDRVQAVEQRQQDDVGGGLGHGAVQAVVPVLVGAPVAGATALAHALGQLVEIGRRGVQRPPVARARAPAPGAPPSRPAGLVRRVTSVRSCTVSTGRLPTKVPRPTWRQIRPSASRSASARRSVPRLTPEFLGEMALRRQARARRAGPHARDRPAAG